ncbi:hypothetical protein NP493_1324g00008 [Ridgeia piscesae]|uniref:Uncharacterized protein n=1 Tax=Ridgeia piscesae TaxID=27915 RepID=A0AAD9K7Q1_RIDPI|nr:hypothetical protein NP493_1324g00008 [Ridgeia piscesae]
MDGVEQWDILDRLGGLDRQVLVEVLGVPRATRAAKAGQAAQDPQATQAGREHQATLDRRELLARKVTQDQQDLQGQVYQVREGLYLLNFIPFQCDWLLAGSIYIEDLCLAFISNWAHS